MKATLTFTLAVACCVAIPASAAQAGGSCAAMSTGIGASLNGFVPFTGASLWNTDISTALVDNNSTNIMNSIGLATTLHPDFGSGHYNNSLIGIPYEVVDVGQAAVPIKITDAPDESDPGPASVPADAPIEGDPRPANGDRHVLILEKGGCWLYELYSAYPTAGGGWRASSAAIWDLLGNEQRPYTWTSADAAGLPIFPGLLRFDEVASGVINHAIRFTVPTTQKAFVLPATHWASTVTNPNAPPMGTRLRLKASFDISGFSTANKVILTALKKYGMILADNGSGIYLSGAPDTRWNNDDLSKLKKLTGANFDVVTQGTIYTPANVPQGAAPVISSFTTNSKAVSAGTQVLLSWSVTGSEYNIITPDVGAVRATMATVAPTKTTSYVLSATNQFGRTTKVVTVTVK